MNYRPRGGHSTNDWTVPLLVGICAAGIGGCLGTIGSHLLEHSLRQPLSLLAWVLAVTLCGYSLEGNLQPRWYAATHPLRMRRRIFTWLILAAASWAFIAATPVLSLRVSEEVNSRR